MNVIINTTIEFNNTLMKALCESDDENIDNENVCLISGEKLEDRPIQLECKHKFNYDSIIDEVRNQKKYTSLETHRCNSSQIKCPYCRHIQTGILPWREGYPKVDNVNWPLRKAFKAYQCSSILKSGKRKGEPCGKKCVEELCSRHMKLKKKAAEAALFTPSNIKNTNEVITTCNSNITSLQGCQAILKSGKRKGQKCGCKIFATKIFSNQNTNEPIKIGFCRRHYVPHPVSTPEI